MKFVFDEYHQYMNLELVKERLQKLKIVYNKESNEEDESIAGTFNRETSEINMYGVESEEELEKKLFKIETLYHELFHLLQDEKDYSYLTELSNEAFTRETIRRMVKYGLLDEELIKRPYGYEFGVGYDRHMYLFYNLAEMLPRETLCILQFRKDENSAVKALMEIDKNDLKSMEQLRANCLVELLGNLEFDKKAKYRYVNEEKNILDLLNYYYKEKNGIQIGADLPSALINMNEYVNVDDEIGQWLFIDFNRRGGNLRKEEFEEFVCGYIHRDYFCEEDLKAMIIYKPNLKETLKWWKDSGCIEIDEKTCEEYVKIYNANRDEKYKE